MQRISLDFSALQRTQWYEYALRFFFGGAITVATGLIAMRYGPVFGGLFLAFPAIFPASATLVEKHETEKKRYAGIVDNSRGRKAAALDARGAALGSLGVGMLRYSRLRLLLPTWRAVGWFLPAALAIWLLLVVLFLGFQVRRIHYGENEDLSFE